MKYKKNYLLKNFTTMAMGGRARFFVSIQSEAELVEALNFAKSKKLPWYVVGEGSNLIAADRGFRGVIIQNRIESLELSPSPSPQEMGSSRIVLVGAGNNLLKLIFKLNKLGLEGLERMAGIPGTVGGAIYGCAGAYGQEIKDCLASVKIFDGKKIRNLSKKRCGFGYRGSIFKKHKNWIITEAAFKLGVGERDKIKKISNDIIKLRKKKYWPGLKCPGSFFKNIKLADLPRRQRQSFIKKIPSGKIIYGKVPTGYLLEEVGAKGRKEGKVLVAHHHANLIYNPGGACAKDVKKLAQMLKRLVKNKFGITIEEEVQYLGFS